MHVGGVVCAVPVQLVGIHRKKQLDWVEIKIDSGFDMQIFESALKLILKPGSGTTERH